MDIYKLGHIYFAEEDLYLAKSYNKPIDNFLGKSYFGGVVLFFLKFMYSILTAPKKFANIPSQYEGILVYGPSTNNRVTLSPIVEKYGKDKMMLMLSTKSIPLWKLYLYALPHLGELITEIRKVNSNKKVYFKLFFHKFWRMYGCEKFAKECLSYYKPQLLIMANDHLELNRALLFAAKDMNIKTLYVQHASVGSKFPSLQFTYSMLDGKDALVKYQNIGDMKGNIYLCGGVRFDVVANLKKKIIEHKTIGIAINTLDDIPIVKNFCKVLKKKIQASIILRPHPQMNSNEWAIFCNNVGIELSTSAKESSFEFINRVSILIANQCSIHLDAAMCRVPSIMYNMSSKPVEDIYQFVKNGLTDEVKTEEEIIGVINSDNLPHVNHDAAKYYNYSYDTPFEFQVGDMISELVTALSNRNDDLISEFNRNFHFVCLEQTNSYIIYSV